jgi:5'-nucleotidase
MAPKNVPTAEEQLIAEPEGGAPNSPPDLRFLHYNDVYHIEAGSQEPVGGYPRFQTLVNYYKDDARFEGQPKALTFFSGDAFNPSIESSITKGKCRQRDLWRFLAHDVLMLTDHVQQAATWCQC